MTEFAQDKRLNATVVVYREMSTFAVSAVERVSKLESGTELLRTLDLSAVCSQQLHVHWLDVAGQRSTRQVAETGRRQQHKTSLTVMPWCHGRRGVNSVGR